MSSTPSTKNSEALQTTLSDGSDSKKSGEAEKPADETKPKDQTSPSGSSSIPLKLALSQAMPTLPLHGKSALVTGGARRIGRAIALALANAGADVAITYRKSESRRCTHGRELEALGVQAFCRSNATCALSPQSKPLCAVAGALRQARYPGEQRGSVRFRLARYPHPRTMGHCVRDQYPRPVSGGARSTAASPRKFTAASSTSDRWADCVPGPATHTTAPQKPQCTCSPKPWPKHLLLKFR